MQVRMKPEVMLEELTNALDAMDTPSGDGINTYVVSKAIHKEGMRVALSGVGGDELFVGYPIFEHYIKSSEKKLDLENTSCLKKWFVGFIR